MIYNKYKINITLNKFLENGYYLYPSVYTYWYLLCSALSEWPLFVKKSQPQTGHLPLLTLFPLHCKKESILLLPTESSFLLYLCRTLIHITLSYDGHSYSVFMRNGSYSTFAPYWYPISSS